MKLKSKLDPLAASHEYEEIQVPSPKNTEMHWDFM
jgi:hypothetical protein